MRLELTSFNIKDFRQVRFDPKHTSLASLEKIIKNETGQDVKLASENVKVTKLASLNDMVVQFAKIKSVNQNVQIALL